MPGVHKIWINAIDAADNTTTVGPAVLTVVQLTAVADSPVATAVQAALTATLTGDSGFGFIWSPGDGTGPLAGAATTHAYTTVGFFTATVTATKGTHTFTATTAVEAVEAVSGLALVNDSPIVVSDTTTLMATVTAGSDVAFTWDLGDGTLTYGSVVRYVYPEKGRYTAVVTATNKVSVLTTTSTVDVVSSAEEITGLVAVNDGPTILGATTTLSATVTAGTNVSYTWDLGDGTPAAGDVVQHIYPGAGQYIAAVTATNEVNVLTTTSTVDVVTSEEEILVYLPLVMRSTTGLSR